MLRKIRPDNAYCLFFPKRPTGKKVVVGETARVWPWEEWNHVKLGMFTISLPLNVVSKEKPNTKDIYVTLEDLECAVNAEFVVVVGGNRDEEREDRLARCTDSCTPSRDLQRKIEFAFFEGWARNYVSTAVKIALKDCKYVELIEDPEYRKAAVVSIENKAREDLAKIGLILVRCTILIEPLPPTGALATKAILTKWQEFKKTLDEAALATERSDNEFQQKRAELDKTHSTQLKIIAVEKKRLENEGDIKFQKWEHNERLTLDVEKKKQIREKEKIVSEVQKEIDDLSKQTQLGKIERDAEICRLEDAKKQDLEDLRRKDETDELAHKGKILQMEQANVELESKLGDLKRKISEVEIELEKKKGLAQAETVERHSLAESAATIEMRRIMMEALPKVMEQAARPIEKMGEIRAISISGATDSSGGNEGVLGSILASASALPLVSECIQLIRGLDANMEGTLKRGRDAKQSPKETSGIPRGLAGHNEHSREDS